MLGRALKAGPVSILILAATGLTVTARPAMASSKNSHAPPRVTAISIRNSSGGTTILNISTTRSIPYRTLKLSNPERLVVDLNGVRKGALKSVYPAQSQILKRVRVGQWKSNPPIVRVVADLKGTPSYRIHSLPSGIRIEINRRTGGSRITHRSHSRRSQPSRIIRYTAEISRKKSANRFPFTVHRFQDLTASLTTPDIPPGDHLVPITRPVPSPSTPKASGTLALVSGILIRQGKGGRIDVDIASTRSIPYRIFQLADPFRLVIDLKDARDSSSRNVYPVGSSVLKRIRIAQWRSGDPSVVRVVADLQGHPIFDVYARRPGIRIDLRPRPQYGRLIRNPFEFATKHSNTHRRLTTAKPDPAMTAVANPPAPGNSLSDLKAIGYIERKGSGTEVIISDHANIYFVPQGGTIEKRFRVLSIAASAVEIQDTRTLQANWLAYSH